MSNFALFNQENPTYVYVQAFVDEVQRAGVQHVVICPGSRSTPLAMVFASQPGIRHWMHVDERSAAFFALGMAKQSQQPVALVCSSGTAAANFFPAIVEAHMSHVPLLILTADRPHELRDCGAPQAIDQNRLYSTYVKWFVDVALPEASNASLRYIRTLANRAVAQTQALPVGPVHLNFPFREPLTPELIPDQPLPPLAQRDLVAWEGRPNNVPYIRVDTPSLAAPSRTTIDRVTQQIQTISRGLIIVGPQYNRALPEALIQLASGLQYPILADPLSQLRSKASNSDLILSSYDAFLRIDDFVSHAAPEMILRFGAMPVSKPVLLYLKHYANCPQIVIDGNESWDEPTQLATEMITTNPVAFCNALLAEIEPQKSGTNTSPSTWLTTWQEAEHVARSVLQSVMQDFPTLFEGRVFSELASILPDKTTLYVGNSMPVRDMDTFFWNIRREIPILGNRGANGIDGLVSSALGASAVAQPDETTVLVLGDLSFFHDMNGLLAASLHHLNLTIVLINNDGGGIFSFLPQANSPEHFEELFGTPTSLNFSLTAQMYGGRFQRIGTWSEFRTAIRNSVQKGGLQIIEVPTERASNVTMHHRLWQDLDQTLGEQLLTISVGNKE